MQQQAAITHGTDKDSRLIIGKIMALRRAIERRLHNSYIPKDTISCMALVIVLHGTTG
jgi:hypothetical protein